MRIFNNNNLDAYENVQVRRVFKSDFQMLTNETNDLFIPAAEINFNERIISHHNYSIRAGAINYLLDCIIRISLTNVCMNAEKLITLIKLWKIST